MILNNPVTCLHMIHLEKKHEYNLMKHLKCSLSRSKRMIFLHFHFMAIRLFLWLTKSNSFMDKTTHKITFITSSYESVNQNFKIFFQFFKYHCKIWLHWLFTFNPASEICNPIAVRFGTIIECHHSHNCTLMVYNYKK